MHSCSGSRITNGVFLTQPDSDIKSSVTPPMGLIIAQLWEVRGVITDKETWTQSSLFSLTHMCTHTHECTHRKNLDSTKNVVYLDVK